MAVASVVQVGHSMLGSSVAQGQVAKRVESNILNNVEVREWRGGGGERGHGVYVVRDRGGGGGRRLLQVSGRGRWERASREWSFPGRWAIVISNFSKLDEQQW